MAPGAAEPDACNLPHVEDLLIPADGMGQGRVLCGQSCRVLGSLSAAQMVIAAVDLSRQGRRSPRRTFLPCRTLWRMILSTAADGGTD